MCDHPPFGALVMLNGHEYVAQHAGREGIGFRKEDNCFTRVTNASDLQPVADIFALELQSTRHVSASVGSFAVCALLWIVTTRNGPDSGLGQMGLPNRHILVSAIVLDNSTLSASIRGSCLYSLERPH